MFTSIYSGNVDGNGDGDGTTKSTKDNPMTTNVWTDAKKNTSNSTGEQVYGYNINGSDATTIVTLYRTKGHDVQFGFINAKDSIKNDAIKLYSFGSRDAKSTGAFSSKTGCTTFSVIRNKDNTYDIIDSKGNLAEELTEQEWSTMMNKARELKPGGSKDNILIPAEHGDIINEHFKD